MQAKIFAFMPLIMTVMMAWFPAGLVLYWITNTLLSIAQQWNINRRRRSRVARSARLAATGHDRNDSRLRSGHADTIAAIATPPGRGGIGIVRVSGPGCRDIARGTARRRCRRRASQRCARSSTPDGEADRRRARALLSRRRIPTPAKTCSNCRATAARSCSTCCCARALAARCAAARPGEFTQRAFLNDKLDLAQAEAIADLIDSGSAQAARAALRSLQGEFSAQVHELAEALLELRHVGRGRDRLSRRGNRLPRRPRARRAHGRRPHAVRRARGERRARARCCATG